MPTSVAVNSYPHTGIFRIANAISSTLVSSAKCPVSRNSTAALGSNIRPFALYERPDAMELAGSEKPPLTIVANARRTLCIVMMVWNAPPAEVTITAQGGGKP